MQDVKVGVVGKILAGDDVGCWVKVQDDRTKTGGYLVHVSRDRDFVESGDDWVESIDALGEYFEESDWRIAWTIE